MGTAGNSSVPCGICFSVEFRWQMGFSEGQDGFFCISGTILEMTGSLGYARAVEQHANGLKLPACQSQGSLTL